ncbi:hypothetical protein ABK040_001738 [Willaertia magna]
MNPNPKNSTFFLSSRKVSISLFCIVQCLLMFGYYFIKLNDWDETIFNQIAGCGESIWFDKYLFCLSPRRVIYGNLSHWKALIPSFLLSPLLTPNIISLILCFIILFICEREEQFIEEKREDYKGESNYFQLFIYSFKRFFKLIFQLYKIQWLIFLLRSIVSFILFRVFGWWDIAIQYNLYNSKYFSACNQGFSSFIIYRLIRMFALPQRSTKVLILLLILSFCLHFVIHLPIDYEILSSAKTQQYILQYHSSYLMDHVLACMVAVFNSL